MRPLAPPVNEPPGSSAGSAATADDLETVELDEPQLEPAEQLLGVDVAESEDDDSYFAPTDPVVIGQSVVCGFSHTAMDDVDVDPSEFDGLFGDEALADAVRQELRADAATSTLDIDVTVEDRVAYLRGRVADIEDVENVEEVASRLPLAEVVEKLDLPFP